MRIPPSVNPSAGSRPIGSRRGLTLLELIVVLAIISIVGSLVLYAVTSSRHAARRTHCSNNLRQLALAMSGYQADFGVYPRGVLDSPSIHVASLNDLGLSTVYHQISFATMGQDVDPVNSTALLAAPATFVCPADPLARTSVTAPGYIESPTSYAGNRGSGVQRYGYNGLFPGIGDPLVSPASVTDGLSTTAMLSEWLVGDDSRDPLRTNFHTGKRLAAPDELNAFARISDDIDVKVARIASHPKGSHWMKGDFAYTFYNHVCKMNGHSCLNGSGFQIGAWTACSLHGRGAQVAFADGHVSFLSDSLNLNVWRAIGSRAGGEIVEIP